MTVGHVTSPSIIPTAPTICLSTRKAVALSVHPTDSPSVIPAHPSSEQSVHPPVTPSMTRQSATPPVSPAKCQSDHPSPSNHLYTIIPRPSGCPPSSAHTSTIYTSPSNHLSLSDRLHTILTRPSDHPPPSHRLYDAPISPSACLSPADCLTATMTHPPIHPSSHTNHSTQDSIHSLAVMNGEQSHTNHSTQDSIHSLAVMNGEQSHMIHHTQNSSQSLAVVNGEQSHKAKKFPRAYTNYDLLLRALDASSIYLRDLRRVAPPKSGEDAHVTHDKCDFGGATLNNPSLGFSYVLPRLWDPGGVRSSANVPRDRSRAVATSRYPYAPRMGHLVDLPNLRRWQELRMSHVKLDNFIHGNITGLNIAVKKIPGLINVIIPTLTRPTPTNHEHCSPYNRQSSRMSFTATAISYIWVTQNLKRRVETASPYEGHTSCTFFARLLDPTSGLHHHTSRLPKILPWLYLTLLTMLGLWGVPYEQPRQVDAPRSTPTYYLGGRVYIPCQFTTPRWGVTHFYQ